MKIRTKDKVKLTAIIFFSILSAVLFVSIISGRLSTEEIVVVGNEPIDSNIPLEQQLEKFKIEEITKKESKIFGNSIARDFSQLSGKIIDFPLEPNTPIPLAILRTPDSGSKFAATLDKGNTVYFLPNAAATLPPVERGDKLNIGVTYSDRDELGEEVYKSSVLYYDLNVINVIGTNIYLEVTLEQDVILTTAEKIGEFFYQLPGQRFTAFCNEEEALLNTDSDTEDGTEDCLNEDYLPESASQSIILNYLNRGEALNESEIVQENRRLKEEIKKLRKNEENSNDDNDEELNETVEKDEMDDDRNMINEENNEVNTESNTNINEEDSIDENSKNNVEPNYEEATHNILSN